MTTPTTVHDAPSTLDLAPAPATTTPVAPPAATPPLDLTPAAPTTPRAPAPAPAPTAPSVDFAPGQRPETPGEAYAALMQGNARFADGQPRYLNQNTLRRDALTTGQNPFAVVFSCADSRVPPELVFDRGLGDLFVVRTAGHVVGPTSIGTIDYAIEHLNTPILAVVGHTSCGAVTATMGAHSTGDLPGGNIRELVDRVLPSVVAASASSMGQADLDACIAEHVNATVRDLPRVSPAIAARLDAGTLALVGMVYHLDSGRVEALSHLGDLT